jgi:teichuronic acid biosynthesis protein TuaE
MPTGFFGNPNDLAVVSVIMLPFFILSAQVFVRLIGMGAILFVVIMTGSRAGLISYFISVFVAIFLYGKPVIKILTAVLFLFGVFVLSNTLDAIKFSSFNRVAEVGYIGDAIREFLFSTELSDDSTSLRRQLIANGLDALWGTNGLGVGGGGSKSIQEIAGVGVGVEITSMHNFWIELLVEAGVIFFFIFFLWYFFLMGRMFLISKRSKNHFMCSISASICIALFTFIFSAISSSSTIYILPMWMMFGGALAVIALNGKAKH